MATYTPPSRAQEVGIPAQSEDEFAPAYLALVTGNEPAVMTQDLVIAEGLELPALTVLMAEDDGAEPPVPTGFLVEADGTAPAIGILVHDVDTTDGAVGAAVYRAGCFNPDALVWNAAYATDSDKFNAFEGAASPTTIIVRRPKTMTIPS